MLKDFKNIIEDMKELALNEANSIYNTSHQVDPEDAYMYAIIMRVLLGTGKFYFIKSEVNCMNSLIEQHDCEDIEKDDLDLLKAQTSVVVGAVIDCLNGDKNRIILPNGSIESIL